MADEAIPLNVAAAVALTRLRGGPLSGPSDEALDRVAVALSALVPILVKDQSTGRLRALTNDELARGAFRGGGYRLEFRDARPAALNLFVQRPNLDLAIGELLGHCKAGLCGVPLAAFGAAAKSPRG